MIRCVPLKQSATRFLPYIALAGLLLIVAMAMVDTGVDPAAIWRGVPNMVKYLGRMIPPAWEKIPSLMRPLLETVEIALVATFFAFFSSISLGLMAAKNIHSNWFVYRVAHLTLNALRSVPSLLYALIFVSMVGLGPLPGIMGLACHVTGALGRYFAEAFELAKKETIEAGKMDGANRFQVIWHIVIPDARPLLIGYTMYYFEHCVRQATLLGLVGAGGIGVPLIMSLRLFRTEEVAACMIVILTTVFALDAVSSFIRRRFIYEEGVL